MEGKIQEGGERGGIACRKIVLLLPTERKKKESPLRIQRKDIRILARRVADGPYEGRVRGAWSKRKLNVSTGYGGRVRPKDVAAGEA